MTTKTSTLVFLLFLLACSSEQTKENLKHKLWTEGEILKINYRGEGDVVQFKMFEGASVILRKNENDVFEGAIGIPNAEEAIFQYQLVIHKMDEEKKMHPIEYHPLDGTDYFKFIGKNRPPLIPENEPLIGHLSDTTLYSQHLQEERTISLYLPKEMSKEISIIYCTDGYNVTDYAKSVDYLIEEEIIEPVILIGIHASSNQKEVNGMNHSMRYIEYVDSGLDEERFQAHQSFFIEEVVHQLEATILKNSTLKKRYLYGVSNGAAFCLHTAFNHPNIFEHIIAFSTVGYISDFPKPIVFGKDTYPDLYLAAGRFETGVIEDNRYFSKRLEKEKVKTNVTFKELICGHDSFAWRQAFLQFLITELN